MRRQDWPQQVAQPHVFGNFRQDPRFQERPLSYQKRRDGNDRAHLELIRQLSCLVCEIRGAVDPHHLKTGPARIERAFGRRATDMWTLPLCSRIHHPDLERHPSGYEPEWFDAFGYTTHVLYYIPLRLWRETRLIKPAGFDAALGRAQRIIDSYKREAIQVLGTRRKAQR